MALARDTKTAKRERRIDRVAEPGDTDGRRVFRGASDQGREMRSSREDTLYSMMTAKVVHRVEVLHVSPDDDVQRRDVAATEEPMQIRLNGEPFAVIMRTPGSDRELGAGFLLSERVIRSCDDLVAIAPHPDLRNVLDVELNTSRDRDLACLFEQRRQVVMNSSCGVCGRVSIESLQADLPTITADWTFSRHVVAELPARLRAAQEVFDETGGLHAAGLFDRTGRLELLAEDVGRHNAVDKVIGRMLLSARLPLDQYVLFVSGRTSFEIVQKAFVAGLPIVGAVSAPSSLAVELADEAGITLLGFVRGHAFNVYTHRRRIIAHKS